MLRPKISLSLALCAAVLLAGCTSEAGAVQDQLPSQLLCLYGESHFGYFLDFDKPDVVGWGGYVPWSFAEDGGLEVVTAPVVEETDVARLILKAGAGANGFINSNVVFTVRKVGSDLLLEKEPDTYDPNEVGSDPRMICVPYER